MVNIKIPAMLSHTTTWKHGLSCFRENLLYKYTARFAKKHQFYITGQTALILKKTFHQFSIVGEIFNIYIFVGGNMPSV